MVASMKKQIETLYSPPPSHQQIQQINRVEGKMLYWIRKVLIFNFILLSMIGCEPALLEIPECRIPNLGDLYSPQVNPNFQPPIDEKVFEDKYWAFQADLCMPEFPSSSFLSALKIHSATLVFQIEPRSNDEGVVVMNFLEKPSSETVDENQPLPLASAQWTEVGTYTRNPNLNQVSFNLNLDQWPSDPLVVSPFFDYHIISSLSFTLEVGTQKQDRFAGDCNAILYPSDSKGQIDPDLDLDNEGIVSSGICQLIQVLPSQ